MTDTTPEHVTTAVAAATKPGADTSEGKLVSLVTKIAAVVMLLGAGSAALPEAWTGNHYVALAIVAIGAATKVLVTLGYAKQRTTLKAAALEVARDFAPANVDAEIEAIAKNLPDGPVAA